MAPRDPVRYEDTPLDRLRHSTAQVMAQAVLEMFPEGKFASSGQSGDRFHYDFDLPRSLTPDDLAQIEKRMREIIADDHAFVRRAVTPAMARKLFKDQPYKLELTDDTLREGSGEHGEPLPRA